MRKFTGSPCWKGVGQLSKTFWSRICRDASKRNIKVEVTIDDAWNLFEAQKGRCALTGRDLTFGLNKNDSNKTASLDRIDSTQGYVVNNLQWVHKDVNRMKQEFSEQYLFQIVKEIAEYRMGYSPK